MNAGLVFGLLDNSAAISGPEAAEKYRDLTISWSRYDYHGPMLEAASVDNLLSEAADRGYRYCLVQYYGHIIRERWNPEHWNVPSFLAALESWLASRDFLVAGHILESESGWFGVARRFFVVDLERYRIAAKPHFGESTDASRELPAPGVERSVGDIDAITALTPSPERAVQQPRLPGWGLIAASLERRWPVIGIPTELADHTIDLEPEDALRTEAFSRFFDRGIDDYNRETPPEGLGSGQREFLDSIARQATLARRGVFLWNIESYADVETPPEDFRSPVSSLYAVAAGFKSNRILETHGFAEDTVVTFFDYSARALELRRELVGSWDGVDFPAFVGLLMEKYPPPGTFYQFWADREPGATHSTELVQAWEDELVRWGGENAFRDHWRRYRGLRHEFIHCDLMTEPELLVRRVVEGVGAVIWFSNAFFTMFSNWHYPLGERRLAYECFIAGLAEANPELYLYGSDHNNTCVNFVRAAEYWREYRCVAGSELMPPKFNRHEIRL